MHSIWAVATNTIRQALRMKIAAVFIILLIVLLPIMSVRMTGDGTVQGRLQTFVSYSFSLTSLLLCLLTIATSVYSVTADIDKKQIYLVLTKPILRFQLLIGKLLGVVLLNVILLTFFSAIIYIITINMPQYLNATETELAALDNEFFTARASLTPAQIDVTREVAKTYGKLQKNNQLPRGLSRSKIIAKLTRDKHLEKRSSAPGEDLLWEFHNIKPIDPNKSLFVRFKYDVSVVPPDLLVYGRWDIGDNRQIKYRTKIETPIYRFDRKDTIRTFSEIEVPADAVAKDGYLAIRFLNVPLNSTVIIFPPKDGLELLYKADSFTANFIRAVLLILIRLIFLACLGILTSTFLSFPVALLFCLVVFFTGTISGFVIDSFNFLGENLSVIYSYTIKPIIQLLPQFDKFNASKFLVPGRLLSWSLLAKAVGLMVCIKSLLLMLFAVFIFSRKEIAKITV